MEDKKKIVVNGKEILVPDKPKLPQEPVGFNTLGESGKEALKIIAGIARKRLAKNITPWGYGDDRPGGKGSTIERGFKTIVMGEKEQDRADMEQYFEKGYGLKGGDEDKLRFDLLSKYGGLKPKYGTLSKSAYRPTDETDKTSEYVDSKIVGKGLLDALSKEIGSTPSIKSKKDLDNLISTLKKSGSSFLARDEKTGEVLVGKKGGVKGTVTGLGVANIGIEEDEKGPYISYYDVWDIDPTSGTSKELEGQGFIEKSKTNIAKFGRSILRQGSKPPEIYGRIYFDKKTGKPIL